MAASKIKKRLGLDMSIEQINRIQRTHLGALNPLNVSNSTDYLLKQMRPYVEECLRRLGKDPFLCETCEEYQLKKCDIHHTRYEGATIYDLAYACRSCNRARANVGLS
jgi:hypothetical protein